MAQDKQVNIPPKKNKFVQNMINNINNGMNKLYRNTYMSTPMNSRDLDSIRNDFNKSLDKLLDTNLDNIGQTNITSLYARTQNIKGSLGSDTFSELLEDNALTEALVADFSQNKIYKEVDAEIDLILKFMPMLADALDAKKDNVLSADNYSKDYINVVNTDSVENFSENIKSLKKIYNVLNIVENAYDDAAKYGEQFIYIDNYKDALTKLLKNKPTLKNNYGKKPVGESYTTFRKQDIVCEAFNYSELFKENDLNANNINEDDNLYVEFSTCGIESAIMEQYIIERSKEKIEKVSMNKSTDLSNIDFEGLSSEGLIKNKKDLNNPVEGKKIDVTGSIVKVLKRENVIPVYMDDTVLGYYYLECELNDTIFSANSMQSYVNMFSGNTRALTQQSIEQQNLNRDKLLKSLSGKLSEYIDSAFINANKDLKEEIYVVLKHNDMFNGADIANVKVSFIPPEKMVHFCFKQDPITHRGISDLEKSLLPAKIYVYLYLNDTIGALRSHDKRIYNVRQKVDTNISQILTNVIAQIKKGNMGARELTSMKTMLNITGRYNDLVVPVGPSGESPIDFQVMDGMQIETKTDLMEMMQEMAINATEVPYEYVQSRKQVDFAIRLTMSSSKFLRTTFKRQAIVEKLLNKMMSILYNNEFPEENRYIEVQTMLPPPGFLQLLNNTQLFESVNNQTEMILNMTYDDNVPQAKRKLMDIKLKKHYLKGYLDWEAIEKIQKETDREYAAKTTGEEEM